MRTSDAKSFMRSTGSRVLAVALITGFGECEEEGMPLTEVQQIHMATMTIMAYSEVLEGTELMDVKLPGDN